jgi:hypothetical protein
LSNFFSRLSFVLNWTNFLIILQKPLGHVCMYIVHQHWSQFFVNFFRQKIPQKFYSKNAENIPMNFPGKFPRKIGIVTSFYEVIPLNKKCKKAANVPMYVPRTLQYLPSIIVLFSIGILAHVFVLPLLAWFVTTPGIIDILWHPILFVTLWRWYEGMCFYD